MESNGLNSHHRFVPSNTAVAMLGNTLWLINTKDCTWKSLA